MESRGVRGACDGKPRPARRRCGAICAPALLVLPAALVLAHGLRGARCGAGPARQEHAGAPRWLRRRGGEAKPDSAAVPTPHAVLAARRALRLRGSGEEGGEGDGSAAAATLDPVRMKKALEKLDEMRAASEITKKKKEERDKATMDYAMEAAKNISEGYTLYGKPGVWYDDYASRTGNASCRDPFKELESDGRSMCGSWAFYENRPVPFYPESMHELDENVTHTRLVPRDALSWRLPNGEIAPQYGNAVGGMGYGTRSVGTDEVALGMLYTNESYAPDGDWREKDEAFMQRIKDERKEFGDQWYRFLPEERQLFEDERDEARGEGEDRWNRGLLDAAAAGDNIKLREFMAKGADVDCIDTRVEDSDHGNNHGNFRAVHYAAMWGHRSVSTSPSALNTQP